MAGVDCLQQLAPGHYMPLQGREVSAAASVSIARRDIHQDRSTLTGPLGGHS